MDTMTKICFIGKTVAPTDTRVWQEVKTLLSPEFSVDVICKRLPDERPFEVDSNITYRRLYKVEGRKFGFARYLIDSLYFILRTFPVLMEISLRKKIDIIVVHTLPEYLIFVTIFHKLTGTKVFLDARDLSVDLLNSRWSDKKLSLLKISLTVVERMACAMADVVFVASDGFRERLIERGTKKEKTVLLLNTADGEIFKPVKERVFKKITNAPKMIYHGTVAERFGVIVAVRAVAELKKRFKDAELHIYGFYDLEYRVQIEREVEAMGLAGNIFLEEPRKIEEIYEIIKTMDLGLVTYLDNDFMNIALSTKTFEYVASGLPVVASRLQSTRRIFSDECIRYAQPGNPHDFAAKILEYCEDADLRRSYSENALKAYAAVSGDVMSERFYTTVKKFS